MTDIHIDLSLLDDLVRKARSRGADAADVLLLQSISLSTSWRMGILESLERAESISVGLRVLSNYRQAVVSSSELSLTTVEQLVEQSMAMVCKVPKDPFCGLADHDLLIQTLPKLDIYDPEEPSAEQLIAMARDAEEAGRDVPGITNSQGAVASWNKHVITLVGSNGLSVSYVTSYTSLSAALLAGNNGHGSERDYEYATAVYLSDLRSPGEIGRAAAIRALRRLGARKVKTQTVPVMYASREAGGLLAHFLSAINGAAVARGTSFLKDSLHTPVFSKSVTIIDDPLRQRGLRSRPCDAEGLSTQKCSLVENGILERWILDLRSSRQLHLRSTGHASRTTTGLPNPSPTNVHIVPGQLEPAALISDIQNGLYVTELFGVGVNGITGDYSCGAVGFWIEQGQLSYPVHEITIAGNLKEMFRELTVANDLEFRYGFDSPTVLVNTMTVAGY